jgi:hypothetical protein
MTLYWTKKRLEINIDIFIRMVEPETNLELCGNIFLKYLNTLCNFFASPLLY